MKLTLIHPFKGFHFEYEFGPLMKVTRPKIEKFDYLPIESLENARRMTSQKLTTREIAKRMFDYYENGIICDGMYGVDICVRELNRDNDFYEDELRLMITVPMFALSTYRDHYKDESLKKLIIDMNLHIPNVGSYLYEIYAYPEANARVTPYMSNYSECFCIDE